MANLNIRNVPDDLYHRVRAAAACGAPRIPKGALEKWVKRALLRAVESNEPGLGAPRLKLCAGCFQKNQTAVLAPRSATAPPSTSETARRIDLPAPKVQQDVFSHLLAEDADSMAAAGMMGIDLQTDPAIVNTLQEIAESNPLRDVPAPVTDSPPSGAGSNRIEVMPGLLVGGTAAFDSLAPMCADRSEPGWSVLSAAKEPWHREMVGYQTKSAPEGPERLVARRGNHMALNLIDVRELGPGGAPYVCEEAVQAGLDFIHERLEAGDQVVVHDTKGVSMAPAIALLYRWRLGLPMPAWRELYPGFEPHAGVSEYLRQKGVTFE